MKYVYKIVAAVAALAIIAIAIFTPLIYIEMESLVPSALVTIGVLLKNETATDFLQEHGGNIPTGIHESISISDIWSPSANSIAEIIRNSGEEMSETAMEALEPVIAPAIAFAATFILIIVCAIVTAILAIVAKNNRKVIYSCITGIGLSFMLTKTFSPVALPFINGDITLETISGSFLVSFLGSIVELELASTIWAIPIVFAVIIVWTILYNITLPEQDKKHRKKMLGEAD